MTSQANQSAAMAEQSLLWFYRESKMADQTAGPLATDKPKKKKKRKVNGRKREIEKKARVSSHETGPDCQCTRLKCFQNINEQERRVLIDDFNSHYKTKDAQDAYLASLMEVELVQRRRPRDNVGGLEKPKSMSMVFAVKVKRGQTCRKVTVCVKAFCSIFGITKNRLDTIRKSLSTTGKPSTHLLVLCR